MRTYKCLKTNKFTVGDYSILPIRDCDKYDILKWRNEQIYHLRQSDILTKEKQDLYFLDSVGKLFVQEKPNQLLFSFFVNNIFIGYGGLVHIDWNNLNAEISFLTDTIRTNDILLFERDFRNFLFLIFKVSFDELNFIKIHTSVYDIQERDIYITSITEMGFVKEAQFNKHVLKDGQYKNIVVFSYFNSDFV